MASHTLIISSTYVLRFFFTPSDFISQGTLKKGKIHIKMIKMNLIVCSLPNTSHHHKQCCDVLSVHSIPALGQAPYTRSTFLPMVLQERPFTMRMRTGGSRERPGNLGLPNSKACLRPSHSVVSYKEGREGACPNGDNTTFPSF